MSRVPLRSFVGTYNKPGPCWCRKHQASVLLTTAGQPRIFSSTSKKDDDLPIKVDVIAHRGASGYMPDHTLETYKAAFESGSDWIEVSTSRMLILGISSLFLMPDYLSALTHMYICDNTYIYILFCSWMHTVPRMVCWWSIMMWN